jgi:hypothetical protein
MKICKIILGEKYGRLEVIEDAGWHYFKDGSRKKVVRCKCICGNISIVQLSALKSKATVSCGCYHSELVTMMNTKHNQCGTKLYRLWSNMKRRCLNPDYIEFHLYGGRGITIYEPWIHNSKMFMEYCQTLQGWDNPLLSIDRIDNNGNYEPNNLRFTNMSIQNRNKRISPLNKTGITGVYFRKYKNGGGWFKAVINVNKKQVVIGYFHTLNEAIFARNKYIKDNNLPEYKIQEILR